MWRFLILVVALFLAACDDDLSSETPEIAEQALSAPSHLKGSYWALDVSSGNLDAWPAMWRWGKGRRGTIDGWAGQARARLIKLTNAGVHLFILDEEKNTSTYFLMHGLERGIIQLDHIHVPTNAFTYQVAARHGFGFSGTNNKLKGIGENFPGEAIPELFKDPDFLATLSFRPATYLLPTSRSADRIEHATKLPIVVRDGDPIELVGLEFTGATVMAQPEGLVGAYVSDVKHFGVRNNRWLRSHRKVDDELTFEVRRLPDGRFGIFKSGDGPERSGLLARLGLYDSVRLADMFEVQRAPGGSPRLTLRHARFGKTSGELDDQSLYFLLDGKEFELKIEQEGSKFELIEAGNARALDTAELEQVLARGRGETYVGTLEELDDEADAPQGGGADTADAPNPPRVITLDRDSTGCWQISMTVKKVDSAPPELVTMRTRLMRAAAQSHGLVYEAGEISGAQTFGQVRDLLIDPRFEHGITSDQALKFCARPPA